jgi:hypothetical protein
MTWSLKINGVTKTLAAWRVNHVLLNKVSLRTDSLSFDAPRARIDEAHLCEFGGSVELLRIVDGVPVRWFVGTCDTIPETAEAAGELQHYVILSPWNWLERNPYQQRWYNNTYYTTHCLLAGTLGENIKAVLDYAIANGANLQYVQAELNVLSALAPINEFTEKYCSSAIFENLEFAPDTVGWFDYSTNAPTLHLQRRSSLTAAAVRFADAPDDGSPVVAAFRPTALNNQAVPSVKINGETINTVDGVQYLIPSVDVYPLTATGREDGVFSAVVLFQGRNTTNVFGSTDCETIDITSLAWLKKHVPGLADPRFNQSTMVLVPNSLERLDAFGQTLVVTYPRELLPGGGGQIAPWMQLDNGDPVLYQREYFRFKVDLEFNENAGDGIPLLGLKSQAFSFELTTTNAPEGHTDYSQIDTLQEGDPPIIGLAEFLYKSLNHFDGSQNRTQYSAETVLIEDECSGHLDLGKVINLLGRRSEFETMRALIQSVIFDIDNGATNIICGPPRQWTIASLLALLERFRTRRSWTNPNTQDTGDIGATTSDVSLGRAIANTNTVPGQGILELQVLKKDTLYIEIDAREKRIKFSNNPAPAQNATSIEIDLDHLVVLAGSGATSLLAKFRLTEVCENNSTKRCYVLRTETFT